MMISTYEASQYIYIGLGEIDWLSHLFHHCQVSENLTMRVLAYIHHLIPILFVDNGTAASCLKVQQMALVNVM